MSVGSHRILQALCVTVLLGSAFFFSVVLTWLVTTGGVIACGRGVLDSPDWPLQVLTLLAPPVVLMFGVGALFIWCSERIRVKKSQPQIEEELV
jgi:hypothetical protein